jgi:hypothetical protein
VADAHGAAVSAANAQGGGARLELAFPAARVALPAEAGSVSSP